jgi:hypothetical protein
MLLSALPQQRWRVSRLEAEASAMEDELGPAAAIQRVRDMIVRAGRPERRRLYRLHDEIARRHQARRVGPEEPSWA